MQFSEGVAIKVLIENDKSVIIKYYKNVVLNKLTSIIRIDALSLFFLTYPSSK